MKKGPKVNTKTARHADPRHDVYPMKGVRERRDGWLGRCAVRRQQNRPGYADGGSDRGRASRPSPPTITRSPTPTAPRLRIADCGLRIDWRIVGLRRLRRTVAAEQARLRRRQLPRARRRARRRFRRSTTACRGRVLRDRGRLRLQLRDHLVDLAARLAHLRLELLVQPAAERLLALAQRVLALAHPRFGGVAASRARARRAAARARARACRGRSSRGARRAALRAR